MKCAWIIDLNKIEVVTHSTHNTIKVKTDLGEEIPVKTTSSTHDGLILHFENTLDLKRNFIIQRETQEIFAFPSLPLLNQHFHYNGKLGSAINDNTFTLGIWSPTATKIEVTFFSANKKELFSKEMSRKEKGVWKLSIFLEEIKSSDFFYQLKVVAFGKENVALDPYAPSIEASAKDFFPRAAFIDQKNATPKGFAKDRTIKCDHNEMIAYETHVRDFTIDASSKIEEPLRGTYSGFSKKINHLKELGITHVQFLPLQNFCTVYENKKKYQDQHTPTIEINYNWGYDAHHYFTPQGWYSSCADNPAARIIELKKMVMDLHQAGIGVIMDVVYNHIYHESFLENIAPGCYIRRDRQGNISGATGAGATLESRMLMARRLIIDSLAYFRENFHVDGFRFDLMEFLDQETMLEIRKKLGKDTILYGEAWEFTDLPFEAATIKWNLPSKAQLGAFNDSARDSYTGTPSQAGFIQGNFATGPKVRSGIIGGIKNYKTDYEEDGHLSTFLDEYKYHCFANSPQECINFLSIHDGLTLWDKINLLSKDQSSQIKKIIKLSMAMLLTSQGRIVLHGGDEFGRSKVATANDPNLDRTHSASHLQGRFHENSYRSADYTNRFDWSLMKPNKDLFNYIKGLIALRKKFPCLHYSTRQEINQGLRFVNENIPNNAKYVTRPNTRHSSWDELPFLTIEFKNGPANSRLYVIGEVHGDQMHSKNPKDNPYFVDFDSDGYGQITFNRQQIDNFDFDGWDDGGTLNIKLVQTPGQWDYLPSMYTRLGNNCIAPNAIKRKKCLTTIDLSQLNHIAGNDELIHQGHICYFLKSKNDYQSLLIIHNANHHFIDIHIKELAKFKTFDILVDNNSTGLTPLAESSTEIYQNRVKVPPKSSTVIGCK